MRLSSRVVRVEDLGSGQRSAMLELMQRHYANVLPEAFAADLAEKHWVIQLGDPATGRLCGFSTQMLLDVQTPGGPIKALFSGDTIIDRAHWGDQALARAWGRLALALIDDWPDSDLYWFLISQGYKTYRFLPLFFHEFYPRFETATPPWAQATIAAVGMHKFPNDFCAVSGVVRSTAAQYRLRDHVAELTPERLRDPHVRFFAEHNPGHAGGNELCCLAPLTRANFTAAAYRVIGQEPAVRAP